MGPPPPNCHQEIYSSLFESSGEPSLFTPGLVVSLPSPSEGSFLDTARRLLTDAGLKTPNDLRALSGLPEGRWICRELPRETIPASVSSADPLLHAAILGLCNPVFYSPDRPVLWTESRLSRCVGLYRQRCFYED
jgi:hypothetical protein